MFNSKYVALVSYLIDGDEDDLDYDYYEADSCEIRIDGSLLITLHGKQTCLLDSGCWLDVSLVPASSIVIREKPKDNSFLLDEPAEF
ncbi:hypothetical protein [Aeromonas finlandensis]|uniref:hypothetical protein n=1 Tax=Aeromonas finlandensis TaxID=1543375 RepID=UPI00051B34BA|nr:hypothetical protein [Aeromonas finlandensis]